MAAYFGTSAATDAWLMASVLPNLLFSTINGTISTTVVPLMTQADAHLSKKSVERFINELFTAIVVVSVLLIILGELLAPVIIRLVAPGFHGHQLTLTIEMTRIMVPTIMFWALGGMVVGILQEREDYFSPAVSPVAINAVRIATIIVLGHIFGIEGVAAGFTLAVFSQLLVTVPALRRHGIRLKWRWHFGHPLLRSMLTMSGPFFVTSSVGTVGVVVDRILASTLANGSIAALNYSYVLVQIPVGLLISSLATPIYTRLAQYHSDHNDAVFRSLAMKGFRLVVMTVVPITVWFVLLRVPILRLLYQHGVFSNRSTALTAGTLLYFAIGLPGFGLSFYLQKLFFAARDTKSPARFSVITIIFNIVGDIILVHLMNVNGLALATALASWVNAFLLTVRALRPRANRDLDFGHAFRTLVVAGLAMAASVYLLGRWLHLDAVHGILPLLGDLTATAVVSLAVYIVFLLIMRFPELDPVKRRLRSPQGRRAH